MSKLTLPEFPSVDRTRFGAAVHTLIEQQARDAAAPSVGPLSLSGRIPKLSMIESGAAQSSEQASVAQHFLGMLEAAFLVAAIDGGVSEPERAALGDLIAQVTNDPDGAKGLSALFDKFGADLTRDGMPARLAAVAAHFDDFMAREEALSFATLIALADGSISRKEARGLIELAEHLGYSVGEVQALLDSIATSLKEQLGA
jgi:tellurite resistance protein